MRELNRGQVPDCSLTGPRLTYTFVRSQEVARCSSIHSPVVVQQTAPEEDMNSTTAQSHSNTDAVTLATPQATSTDVPRIPQIS